MPKTAIDLEKHEGTQSPGVLLSSRRLNMHIRNAFEGDDPGREKTEPVGGVPQEQESRPCREADI